MSVTAPWKVADSAYTSVRLHVDTTMTSPRFSRRVERHGFEQGQRRGVVGQTQDHQAHPPTALATRGTTRSAAPLPLPAASILRCSWKAKICSSVDRSTLRTSTPSGTTSTHGAKL